MSKSIKKNYIYNLINTVTQLLFPLITYPYVTRVLGYELFGHVNFLNSIITYITLGTSLGIPIYGIREIAKVKDNPRQVSHVTLEILLLHLSLSLIGYIVVTCFSIFDPRISESATAFLILSATIFFTALGCNWFYQGVEDFRYITLRSIIVKIVSIILLFIFVKTKNDVLWYCGYLVIGVLGGNLFNFFRLRKYISFKGLKWAAIKPFRHLRAVINVFALSFLASLYQNLNTVVLGYAKGDGSVAFYTMALKLVLIGSSILNSFTYVLIPRLSEYSEKQQGTSFASLAQKSWDINILISLPLSIGFILMAPELIQIFSTSEFEPAIITIRILALLVLVTSLSSVLGLQILYSLGKIGIQIRCAIIGACVNFTLLFFLTKILGENGVAISYITAEISVLLSLAIIGRKFIPIQYIKVNYYKYAIATLVMSVVVLALKQLSYNIYLQFALVALTGSVVYFFVLLILKDTLIRDSLKSLKTKVGLK